MAGELTLFSLHPLPCVPMSLNPACLDHSLSSPLGFSLYLTLFFPFLCIPEWLSFCVSGSLFLSPGCVSVCCYFFPSLFSFSVCFSLVSFCPYLGLYFYLFQCVCVSFSVCLFLSFSVYLLSSLSLSLSLPPPLLFLRLSVSLRLSRPHFLPSCLPAAPCAWSAPTAAGSGERVRSDCPGGHLMD